ncbi:MAG: hypothetical protein R3E39_08880 [Anaerolineae bacterium]
MNTRMHHHGEEAWLAGMAALVVLFSAMLEAHISAVLSFSLIIVFAAYKFIQSRHQ